MEWSVVDGSKTWTSALHSNIHVGLIINGYYEHTGAGAPPNEVYKIYTREILMERFKSIAVGTHPMSTIYADSVT